MARRNEPSVKDMPAPGGNEHYMGRDMQPWDIWEAFNLDPWTATAVKYLLRAGKKSGEDEVKDLRKARYYVDYLIERAERRK